MGAVRTGPKQVNGWARDGKLEYGCISKREVDTGQMEWLCAAHRTSVASVYCAHARTALKEAKAGPDAVLGLTSEMVVKEKEGKGKECGREISGINGAMPSPILEKSRSPPRDARAGRWRRSVKSSRTDLKVC